MLVIDASDTVRVERYPLVLAFLAGVVEQFEVRTDRTRFGAIVYGSTVTV